MKKTIAVATMLAFILSACRSYESCPAYSKKTEKECLAKR